MSLKTLSPSELEKLMDGVNWKLVELLQADARTSYSELGRIVGLSSPAVAERVRRLEEAGVIEGYRAVINPARVGLPIQAIMRLKTNDCRWAMDQLAAQADELPEIIECYRVTGEDSLVLRIAVADVAHLEALVDRVRLFGELTTSIILSTLQQRDITLAMFEAIGGIGE